MVYELRITGADNDGAEAVAKFVRSLGYDVTLRNLDPGLAAVDLADHPRSVDPSIKDSELKRSALAAASLFTLEDLINISFVDFWKNARPWYYELLELMAEHGARFTDADPKQLLVHDIVSGVDLARPDYQVLLKAKIRSALVLSLLPKSALKSIGVDWKMFDVIDRLLRKRGLRS